MDIIKYLVESIDILKDLEVDSLEQLELNLNKKTGFKNPHISASAMSVETEYNRLLQLENLIDNRISIKDLNALILSGGVSRVWLDIALQTCLHGSEIPSASSHLASPAGGVMGVRALVQWRTVM